MSFYEKDVFIHHNLIGCSPYMKTGWNTWNVRSVLSHVLLPEAFAINLGIKSYSNGQCLTEALIGRQGKKDEVITPGPHAYDGSFTSLEIEWGGTHLRIETAVEGGEWYGVVTPLNSPIKAPSLVISTAVLWNRPGFTQRKGNDLVMENESKTISVHSDGKCNNEEPVVELNNSYLLIPLDQPLSISTNQNKLQQTQEIVEEKKSSFLASRNEMSQVYNAMQICLAWDTIYDPYKDRVISPVSRIWSCTAGGWTLFDWDTYFASWMAAIENKELAYANAIAITDEATEEGFIPNCAHPSGFKTRDRSQPPVGAMTVQSLCEIFNENVLAEKLFDQLLQWNRWWEQHRDREGYLCWGSKPYPKRYGHHFEDMGVGERFGGALESGLDNSPMYDDVPFDEASHLLLMGDVGLMSLYIADCNSLVALAEDIGRNEVISELKQRSEKYSEKLKTMWCEKTGLYLNKNLATGEFCQRLSPTHFYPMIAKVPSQEQAQRMVDEHFFNPEEFWGEWILPSIARNDPAYPDQRYWRGRIWAPMNFLVYLGIRNYDLPRARAALVDKSEALLLKEWNEHGHVHENYHGDAGTGCDIPSSDAFYHWGGLLGLISFLDKKD